MPSSRPMTWQRRIAAVGSLLRFDSARPAVAVAARSSRLQTLTV